MIAHVLSVSEIPAHTHAQNAHSHAAYTGASDSAPTYVAGPGWDSQNLARNWRNHYQRWDNFISSTVATNQNTGGGAAHNNLQPWQAQPVAIRI